MPVDFNLIKRPLETGARASSRYRTCIYYIVAENKARDY